MSDEPAPDKFSLRSIAGLALIVLAYVALQQLGLLPTDEGEDANASGTVTATDPVQPDAPPTIVGNLLLRDATGVRMVRRVDGLYEPIAAKGKGGDFEGGPNIPVVQPGSLEGSSINVAQQLVSFMDMSRSFEIKIKMISEMKELDDSGTTMMRYA